MAVETSIASTYAADFLPSAWLIWSMLTPFVSGRKPNEMPALLVNKPGGMPRLPSPAELEFPPAAGEEPGVGVGVDCGNGLLVFDAAELCCCCFATAAGAPIISVASAPSMTADLKKCILRVH